MRKGLIIRVNYIVANVEVLKVHYLQAQVCFDYLNNVFNITQSSVAL